MANEAHNVMNDRKTDRQDAQHILRLLNMISADLGSELGEPDCPDFSASHSIDGQVDEI
jgi:hypothetical protein